MARKNAAAEVITTDSSADIEALSAVLDDLELETIADEELIEQLESLEENENAELPESIEPIEELNLGALDADELKQIEAAEARLEAYAEQDVATAPAPVVAAPVEDRKKRAAAVGVSKRAVAAGTRVVRSLGAIDAKHFILVDAQSGNSAADLEDLKNAVIAARPTQVKIAEKYDNLFIQLAAGKKPSTYVMSAFELLDRNRVITSKDLVSHFVASGLGAGTANSQAGQIMVLFDTTNIAERSSGSLALRTDSVLAAKLRALKGS